MRDDTSTSTNRVRLDRHLSFADKSAIDGRGSAGYSYENKKKEKKEKQKGRGASYFVIELFTMTIGSCHSWYLIGKVSNIFSFFPPSRRVLSTINNYVLSSVIGGSPVTDLPKRQFLLASFSFEFCRVIYIESFIFIVIYSYIVIVNYRQISVEIIERLYNRYNDSFRFVSFLSLLSFSQFLDFRLSRKHWKNYYRRNNRRVIDTKWFTFTERITHVYSYLFVPRARVK